jgi:hypothetical protein
LVIEELIIPDPCYYHERETSKIFDLFYELLSVNGGHPTPTILNYLVTIATGGLLGLVISRGILKTAPTKTIQ